MSQLKPPVEKPVIPLSLEDSCLAWLVIDLEYYPPELLALLPLRLRYRLLANLPVLDLCQLEHTCVAEGIDLESIWELKCSTRDKSTRRLMAQRTMNLVSCIDLSDLSWRDRYLHAVATTILSSSTTDVYCVEFLYQGRSEKRDYFLDSNYYTVVIDWLISLKGYQFLNESGYLESSYDWLSLASSFLFFEAEYGSRYDRLTPPRYAPYKSSDMRLSDEELITLLLRNCHFKTKILLALPSNLPDSALLSQTEACDILKEFLSEMEEMHLYVVDNLQTLPIVLFQSLFCSPHPKLRKLQVLFCRPYFRQNSRHDCVKFQKSVVQILVDVIKREYFLETIYLEIYYSDTRFQLLDEILYSAEFRALTASLTSFIARPQFHTLDINRFWVPPDVATRILCDFLVLPCSHQQTLKLPSCANRGRTLHPSSTLDPVTHCSGGPMSIPDVGVEYKELCLYHSRLSRLAVESYDQLYKTLFAFPKIRLRSLEVGCLSTRTRHYVNVLHMAAQHPNVQVKTLSIFLLYESDIPKLLPTLHDDMRSLLQIPTLINLNLPAEYCYSNVFLPILAQELPKRHHLAAIEELNLGRNNFLELPSEEMELLFQSIFSLPQLSQLTLKLTYSVVTFQHYKLIHRLWTEHSSGECLKKLVVGSAVLMSEKDYTTGSSVTEIMSLLDSMAQSTNVVKLFNRRTVSMKAGLIRAELQISD